MGDIETDRADGAVVANPPPGRPLEVPQRDFLTFAPYLAEVEERHAFERLPCDGKPELHVRFQNACAAGGLRSEDTLV